jgi:hypothetical protein
VPAKGLLDTARSALGAIFIHQLALLYRHQHGQWDLRKGALVWEKRLGSVPGIDIFRITRRTIETLGFNPSGQEAIESGPKRTFEGRRA